MSSCICQGVLSKYYTVNFIVCFLHLFILLHHFLGGLWMSLVQWNVLLAVSINGCGLKGSNSHNPAPNGLERWVRSLNSLTRLLLPLSKLSTPEFHRLQGYTCIIPANTQWWGRSAKHTLDLPRAPYCLNGTLSIVLFVLVACTIKSDLELNWPCHGFSIAYWYRNAVLAGVFAIS